MTEQPKAPWPHGGPQPQPWVGYGIQVGRRTDAWTVLGTVIGVICAVAGLAILGFFVFILFAFSNSSGSNK